MVGKLCAHIIVHMTSARIKRRVIASITSPHIPLAIVVALACGLGAFLGALPAVAADFVMKFGTATINETQHQFIKFYKDEVEKASNGRIEVQIYPASQLGPIPREIEGVQLGNIQGYIGPVDFFVGVDPRFGVFSAPMLFRDEPNAAATVHDRAVQSAMFELAAPKRMVGIATLDLGSSNYGAKSPILRLSDFSGKKLRINGTELERQKMAKLGATGIGMPLSEVVPALDQGTIDGTISGLSVFVSFKMNDLLKVVTATNDTFIISIAVVSKPWLRLDRAGRHRPDIADRGSGPHEDAARSGGRRSNQRPAGSARHAGNGPRRCSEELGSFAPA